MLGGQSPWAALQAWADWAFHPSISPGRPMELVWRWLEGLAWLSDRSRPELVKARATGGGTGGWRRLCEAPGTYVVEA
jgi:hypothetical protein